MSSYATTCPEARTCTLLSLNSRSNSGHPGGTVEAMQEQMCTALSPVAGATAGSHAYVQSGPDTRMLLLPNSSCKTEQPCCHQHRGPHLHAAVAEQQVGLLPPPLSSSHHR